MPTNTDQLRVRVEALERALHALTLRVQELAEKINSRRWWQFWK